MEKALMRVLKVGEKQQQWAK